MLSIRAAGKRAVARSLSSSPKPKKQLHVVPFSRLKIDQLTFHNQCRLLSSASLPEHLVVGMPALSPTMEAGTISSWKVGEGEAFAAGDSLAEIETDKATIDFEAQDEGVVAKILKEAGATEINVGVPILVTVDDEGDVAAFKDFVVVEEGGSSGSSKEDESMSTLEGERGVLWFLCHFFQLGDVILLYLRMPIFHIINACDFY